MSERAFEKIANGLRELLQHIRGRDNEFDTREPGPSRPMIGLLSQLTPEQLAGVISYDGPEYSGGFQSAKAEGGKE